ncbi:TATA-box binding protein [Corchorus olitorius]|uniref:TATA-box binding protein n=1 Tax=Corchorus olitorius TaxID=93759 RepID=A0A1R3GRZ6_9ROSI|nr:TATA-box binding protein [Corchorus olitorius]
MGEEVTAYCENPKPVPILQNVVSTLNLGCPLDLKATALKASPNLTKSVQDSKRAAKRYARIVQKLGFNVVLKDFKIQNMVASVALSAPVKVVELSHSDHFMFITYEPEIFPGLIYRMRRPNITILVFPSGKGKLLITGAKVRQEIDQAFDNIFPLLLSFARHDNPDPFSSDS